MLQVVYFVFHLFKLFHFISELFILVNLPIQYWLIHLNHLNLFQQLMFSGHRLKTILVFNVDLSKTLNDRLLLNFVIIQTVNLFLEGGITWWVALRLNQFHFCFQLIVRFNFLVDLCSKLDLRLFAKVFKDWN